ncbi:peptidase [Flavobacterium sp. WLB]|uniref:M48 family metalloprotease n=1 Tax=unclassified Flavobacterium TaxID=196869 RepID=UPI0006ABB4B1|nr:MULTISPECIES: M48 family metalloprotease [unclassified Flavobacterium]KOP37832.1 peptidase [Flavobacterium sp. VMW]OWU90937.1 peptidase [Flavobacterium sp. NLM]PUU70002.1 peptidase [Flavobacterium sp. WLB]
MKKKFIVLGILFAAFGFTKMDAQILSDKTMGALGKGVSGFTFSDADAAALAKESIAEMDANNPVAAATDGYSIRLNRLFGKHTSSEGVTLNYKVYLVKDINAFACADGSVRVFAGLMDIMDDNELLAVIGHEIGHVVNHDTRDAIKAAYKKEALLDAASSQSGKIETLTGSQLGKIGSAMIDSKHSRKQESQADTFSYDFMKKNGYDVNAVESAFRILQNLSESAEASFITKMMSSHPDSGKRADDAKKRAVKDGLYKEYVQQKIVNTAPAKTTTKAPAKATAKKTTTKKK